MAATIQAPQSSSGSFDAPPPSWLALLETTAPWLLLALLVLVVARAISNRRRYRAVAVLDESACTAVREALATAERRTVGEILPVVLERSDRHPGALWMAGLGMVLIGSALLQGQLPWSQPALLLLCQLGLAALGYGLARLLPDLQRLFISPARATEVSGEQAFQEFYRQGLHKTEGATGVLIFVSLLERRVVLLGDEGIAEHLPADFWDEVDAAILTGIRRGSLRDGLLEGIRLTGEALAEHAPWQEGDRNEIPDRLIVRRE